MRLVERHPDWAVQAVRIRAGGRQPDGSFVEGKKEPLPPVLLAPGVSPESSQQNSLVVEGKATLYGSKGLKVSSTDQIEVLTEGAFCGMWEVEGDVEAWPMGTVIHLSRLGAPVEA